MIWRTNKIGDRRTIRFFTWLPYKSRSGSTYWLQFVHVTQELKDVPVCLNGAGDIVFAERWVEVL